MKVSGQVCGMPISWKVDTGAKKTFISLKAYKSIPYRNRPVLRQQSNSLSLLVMVFVPVHMIVMVMMVMVQRTVERAILKQ